MTQEVIQFSAEAIVRPVDILPEGLAICPL
jgi:hypothetical protein